MARQQASPHDAHADRAAADQEPGTAWGRRPLDRRSILKSAAAAGGALATLGLWGNMPVAARAATGRSAAATAKAVPVLTPPARFNRAPLSLASSGLSTLFSGLQGAIGCRYRLSHDQLLFVAFDSGELLAYPVHGPLYAPFFRGIRGTGYAQPEDVALSADDRHVYVTERGGTLLRVDLASPQRSAATVVSNGLNAPQQIALDESNNRALVVEYASPGRLVSIDLTSGAQTTLVSTLENAVGLAITQDSRYAYVSEQASGGGTVSRFDLSAGGARTAVATGFTAPFFLTWSDAGQTVLYMTDRDPANSVVAIDLSSTPGTVTTLSSALPFRPSCVAVVTPDRLLITSDSAISDLRLLQVSSTSPLLLGIGFVPYNKISGGLATTDPGYFFQVQSAPFAGQLPLMINHGRAYSAGIRFYTVLVDGVEQHATWTDYLLDGAGNFVLQTISSVSGNYYAVRQPMDTWYNPYLGFFVNSPALSNGMHTITLRLYTTLGGPAVGHRDLAVRIDNNRCTAAIAAPLLDGSPADPNSGVMTYARDGSGNPSGTVTLAFTASHPNNFATYSFGVVRGVTAVSLASRSGPVASVASPVSPAPSAQDLLGTLPVAGFAESLYVAATAIDGWSRQSQYDASAAIAFVLAPTGCGA